MWINAEEVRFDSDGEVSDVSEIWSEYGEEVVPDVEPRVHKWNPLKKNVSQKISLKDRNKGKKKKKKSKLKRQSTGAQGGGGGGSTVRSLGGAGRRTVHGMSFVPIGSDQDPPQGVYFLDFSAHFKRSLR